MPEVLLSGHHENIRKWRRQMALQVTLEKRPDLLEKVELLPEDESFLKKLKNKNDDRV